MEASLMIHSWNLISLLSARALSYCTVEMRGRHCSETKFWPGTLFYFASQVSLSWIRNVMEIGSAYDNFHLHTFGRYDSVPPAQSIIIIIIISNRNSVTTCSTYASPDRQDLVIPIMIIVIYRLGRVQRYLYYSHRILLTGSLQRQLFGGNNFLGLGLL